MKFIPRFFFWIGLISLGVSIILKIVAVLGGGGAWPFILRPNDFLEFSTSCFFVSIAYCVVFIFSGKAE